MTQPIDLKAKREKRAMNEKDRGQDGAFEAGDGKSAMPDAVWRKFLDDTEEDIRASAPLELSARERAAKRLPGPVDEEPVRHDRKENASDKPGPARLEEVGEVWTEEEQWPGLSWRDMDGPARRRRAGRTLAAIAAVVMAAGALCYASDRSDTGNPLRDATSTPSGEGPTTGSAPDELPHE
ncbi:hypothetical protein ACIRJO_26970 [Streptomyces sp. NPDC102394]|uniref:hypothetical protein n=1 Tax=Streptomyces sp. NPDC102394 TaxID=3366167 RepID=UPI00380E6B4D